MSIGIEDARLEDIPSIIHLFEKLSLEKQTGHPALSKTGFLVYPNSEQDLVEAIENEDNILLVAKSTGRIIGYCLSYNLVNWERMQPGWRANLSLEGSQILPSSRTLYYRQIACLSKYSGTGLKLINNLHTRALDLRYQNILGEISESPPNTVSLKIHLRKGYREIGSICYRDPVKWKVFMKTLS